MKFFFLVFFLLSSKVFLAQETENNSISFEIGCGWSGITSPEIFTSQELIQSKKYVLIKKRLFSGDWETAILSAISLCELERRNILFLSAEEQDQIIKISNSEREYSVCYTCTEHFQGTIKQLLTNNRNPANILLRNRLFSKD